MSTYTLTIASPESEKDFSEFLSTHADTKATLTEATQYDPNMYDEEGNFQWISLAAPGLPVTDEYMAWRIEQSRASPKISKEEFLTRLRQRTNELYHV